MTGQRFRRRKAGRVYEYASYRCGFATAKGAAVCRHTRGYSRDRPEATLLGHVRAARTPAMIEHVTRLANAALRGSADEAAPRRDAIQAELDPLTREVQHVVRFVAEGGDSPAIRTELQAREARHDALRQELGRQGPQPSARYPEVHPTWVLARLERLDQLIRTDPLGPRPSWPST